MKHCSQILDKPYPAAIHLCYLLLYHDNIANTKNHSTLCLISSHYPMTSPKQTAPTLKQKIISTIREQGPLPVENYMEMALADSTQGYYRIQDPLGQQGDFTTAPEISQVFGELVGAWFLTLWAMTNRPDDIQLIELGPGRGTLMSDILRTARLMPNFLPSANLHFVETSPALRKKQAQAIGDTTIQTQWHQALEDVRKGTTFLVANEFLDALPIRHFIWQDGDWHERLVDVNQAEELFFSIAEESCTLPNDLPHNPELFGQGDILEYRPHHQTFINQLASRAQKAPLVALVIDYGYMTEGPGETFQAIKSHKYTDPLKEPGHADLTAHVDFGDLAKRATKAGLKAYDTTQGQFLMSLGLAQRTQQILQTAKPDEAKMITTGAQRLVDPNQMGQLFKVMVLTSPDFPVPPPFEA